MTRTPLIAGNGKMNNTLVEARALTTALRAVIDDVSGVDVLLCPPVTLLFPMAKAVAGSFIELGAQDVHEATHGAFTGEVSAAMLKETGCTHVIVGHSERRQIFGEESGVLAQKVRAVVSGGMTAIYCVGETLEEWEAGRTADVVERQMNEVINRDVDWRSIVVAYEPVWAIGTGKTATPAQAGEVHARIRALLRATYSSEAGDAMRILYGGSVKPQNADDLLRQPDIDGALVGGACLDSASFAAIITSAASLSAVCN